MKTVYIIGAGQLGSRHLQALKSVNIPLSITVIDPFESSLNLAKERYDSYITTGARHTIRFFNNIPKDKIDVDVAIIPTNSKVRRQVIEELLMSHPTRFIILEKLLFQKKDDYAFVSDLFKRSGSIVWVNCSMRQMPLYYRMKESILDNKIIYNVTGSQYGLITNAIHYLDHAALLTDCSDFVVDTSYLDTIPIESKRKGFIELNGTLVARFKNGSYVAICCMPSGTMPVQVEIFSNDARYISRESEGKAWISSFKTNWQWNEVDAKVPYQSQMTKELVESILNTGTCRLVPFEESSKIHLTLLETLLDFLNKKCGLQHDYYPFT